MSRARESLQGSPLLVALYKTVSQALSFFFFYELEHWGLNVFLLLLFKIVWGTVRGLVKSCLLFLALSFVLSFDFPK